MENEAKERIERALNDFLDESISLRAFQFRYTPDAIDIERSGDQSIIGLVYSVDGILAEGAGRWSESDIREELANAVLAHLPVS
ncbi:MAG TPA: hypothetical protein VGL53_23130 [Bryobacteraceae bacterium]|jgi:hypothetical protein